MIQLELERGPALFCHTPKCEFSVSSLKQVREGEGDLQHFLSFALRIAESDLLLLVVVEVEEDVAKVLLLLFDIELLSETGKFVFAFLPLIKMAASSYALAASSAASNVPNQTLLFLFQIFCKFHINLMHILILWPNNQ